MSTEIKPNAVLLPTAALWPCAFPGVLTPSAVHELVGHPFVLIGIGRAELMAVFLEVDITLILVAKWHGKPGLSITGSCEQSSASLDIAVLTYSFKMYLSSSAYRPWRGTSHACS